jgi:hypothetical protein
VWRVACSCGRQRDGMQSEMRVNKRTAQRKRRRVLMKMKISPGIKKYRNDKLRIVPTLGPTLPRAFASFHISVPASSLRISASSSLHSSSTLSTNISASNSWVRDLFNLCMHLVANHARTTCCNCSCRV